MPIFLARLARMVTTRVRVTKMDSFGPSGSARSVHTIFAYPGSSNAANSSGGSEWKVTRWCHGCV